MYESFFGLQQEPFSIAPDPRFLYMSAKHREALELLGYGLTRGASFVLLTGEIGAGKTTVWRRFLEELPSNYDVASVVNPKLDTNALLARVFEDLHVDLPAGDGPVDPIDALHGHLLLAHAQGRRTLIVIDEAQALSNEVLEQLRLLTNLDSSGRKLQVMLIGQPELRQMMMLPQLEPLAQRVVARYHLPALSESETAGYIAHRLAVAGLRGPVPFDGEALGMIHRLCGGVPRRINVVCDRAMASAQAVGSRVVDRQAVDRAMAAVYGGRVEQAQAVSVSAESRGGVHPWAAAGVAGAALAAGIYLAPRFMTTTSGVSPAGTASAMAAASVPGEAASPALSASAAGAAAIVAAAPPPAPAASVPAVATTAAAPAPASTVAAAAASASTPSSSPALDTAFTPATADEAAAWRALAGLWGVTLASGDPCTAALAQSLRCWRSRGGMADIRQIDRPGLLRLVDERGRVAHALLVGSGGGSVTLTLGDASVPVPLSALARVWRGEYATFWRAPPGYHEGEVAGLTAASGERLLQRLAAVDGQGTRPGGKDGVRARVAAFQVAHGLTPDGLVGPLTLMQLGRASGTEEPRLTRN